MNGAWVESSWPSGDGLFYYILPDRSSAWCHTLLSAVNRNNETARSTKKERAMMPVTRTVCFRVSPRRLAVLQALAQAQAMTVRAFLRGVGAEGGGCAACNIKGNVPLPCPSAGPLIESDGYGILRPRIQQLLRVCSVAMAGRHSGQNVVVSMFPGGKKLAARGS